LLLENVSSDHPVAAEPAGEKGKGKRRLAMGEGRGGRGRKGTVKRIKGRVAKGKRVEGGRKDRLQRVHLAAQKSRKRQI